MKRISIIGLSLIIWGLGWRVAQAAPPNLGSSFKEWCLQQSSLSASLRKTVEVLLERTGTSNCSQADEILSSLTNLFLGGNQITDVSPLSSLTNLTELKLARNQITDVSPLSSLTNLTELKLWDNQITDISPLSSLTNLTELSLNYNQITDVSPLSSLTNLTWLDFQDNPIAQPTCPVSSRNVCSF
ncbi:leucine-rich repeat domain-containing protein [Coleofasciculus sp.]|uniref:leucine-rich repeat domain-containing protein n=1 Tax=Coleofasciculus sp. TaxID=3100458 RepID=UPI0039F84DC8